MVSAVAGPSAAAAAAVASQIAAEAEDAVVAAAASAVAGPCAAVAVASLAASRIAAVAVGAAGQFAASAVANRIAEGVEDDVVAVAYVVVGPLAGLAEGRPWESPEASGVVVVRLALRVEDPFPDLVGERSAAEEERRMAGSSEVVGKSMEGGVCLFVEETCCSGVSFDFANAMRLWEEFTVAALAGHVEAVRMASDFDEAMVRRERVGHRDSGRVVMEHHQLLEGGTEALRLSVHQQWSCWKERRGTCLRAAFHPLPPTE